MDLVEWYLLASCRKIFFAGQTNMEKRPSSYGIRAADFAAAEYIPIHQRCTGQTYSVANTEARRYYAGCLQRTGSAPPKLNQ